MQLYIVQTQISVDFNWTGRPENQLQQVYNITLYRENFPSVNIDTAFVEP